MYAKDRFILPHYVPGRQPLLADTLSRIQGIPLWSPEGEQDVTIHATSVLASIVSENTKTNLACATRDDPYLSQVVESLQERRPVLGDLAPFSSKLSYVDGVFLRGRSVIIPKSLPKDMLRRLHEGL